MNHQEMRDFYCDQALAGKLELEVVEETPYILAFQHTNPYFQVHIVVIPKTHIESIDTLLPEHDSIVLDAMHVISRISAQVRAAHGGCTVSTNIGTQQTTRHLHWFIHFGKRIRDEAGNVLQHDSARG